MGRNLTTETFKDEVNKADRVIVDFYADWCGPCKMMAPLLDEIENELGENIVIFKVNIVEQDSLATEYSVMNIPTLILFENGEPTNKIVGFRSKEAIVSEFNL